ncbi:MAG: GNAT family N-acetyltransferase [Candidatus Saccharimonadales bacterium]
MDPITSWPRIEPAKPEDFEVLKAMLDSANAYGAQQTHGVRLWTVMDYVYAQLRKTVENGEMYVIRNDEGKIAASIAFNLKRGRWKDIGAQNGEALYFHKWMKNPDLAQPGDAKALLKFVAQEAKRLDRKYLRCDTVPELTELIEYYKRLGFSDMGHFVYESSGRPGILLQADTDTILRNLS